MYPQRQLTLLAVRKSRLQQRIARRRVQCVVDTARVTKPLEWLDQALTIWRRVPLIVKRAVAPFGLLIIKRTLFKRSKR